ncbi:MAG: hypothetical protein KKB53_06250 [Acidobacteria bacterium]|nr:hypothetical protein [Acidobacteriota bacterium]
MIKKPHILSIVLILAMAALVMAFTSQQTVIQSKASHAEDLWETSGHADSTAEAFRHWDEDDPAVVPTGCAKCHSAYGFIDFIQDGTVDAAAKIDSTVNCDVCHINPNTGTLRNHTAVTFPSGVTVEGLGPEAMCMECHQGRASKKSVDATIAGAGVADDDVVSRSIRFSNIHYFAAAASQFGTVIDGGYEYAGKSYDARFSHVDGYNACHTCHNPHSLEVRRKNCATCHTFSDPKDIRFLGSCTDYDGDGNAAEGIYYEITTMADKLYATMQHYANTVTHLPIAYDSHTYPYFFNDTNGNGQADADEAVRANGYSSFTPRLVKAAYNYQMVLKDPAGYAHGGKYLIQLMYDSIEDLNSAMPNPVSMAGMSRTDEGHFDGSAEAWRHWDEDGEVSSSCAKCHSATGLAEFLSTGANTAAHTANGMLCTTCHTGPPLLISGAKNPVKFPSGAVLSLGDTSNLCMNCHSGRASGVSVNNSVGSGPGPYRFINIHYFAAAATLFGSEANGGYEFAGKTYAGRRIYPNHNGRFDTCVDCHMNSQSLCDDCGTNACDHNVKHPDAAQCVLCHGQDISQPYPGADPAKFKFNKIRPASTPDYDGDRNTHESIQDEIKGLETTLYKAMQDYGLAIGNPILYDSHSYPYWFIDTNGNGKIDTGENTRTNAYQFNARMLKAAYNFQVSKKDPAGFVHNSRYIAQLLVDSIEIMGGDISAYTWR